MPYSQIPFELAAEIASHNARDLDTLRAMALTSSSMRSSVIPSLFAAIRFPWSETGESWAELLESIPDLPTTVKTVHFRWPPRLHYAEEAPSHAAIPLMPHVRTVHWSLDRGSDSPIHEGLNVADPSLCLSKFPNMAELHLNASFTFASVARFLGSCGPLSALYLYQCGVTPEIGAIQVPFDHSAHRSSTLFDLSALETLDVQNIGTGGNYLIDLMEHSPPRALKSLTLGVYYPRTMRKLLMLGSGTLERLVVVPHHEFKLRRILDGLLPFGALYSLAIWPLTKYTVIQTTEALRTFPAAPNLITIAFRIPVGVDATGYLASATVDAPTATADGTMAASAIQNLAETMWKLREALPEDWARARFPRLEQLKFQFCVPKAHASAGTTTRELAFYETMEGVVIQHFPRALVQWLDWEYNVVRGAG